MMNSRTVDRYKESADCIGVDTWEEIKWTVFPGIDRNQCLVIMRTQFLHFVLLPKRKDAQPYSIVLFLFSILIHFILDNDSSAFSAFEKLQTDWSQDQVPHVWDLILASVCLSEALTSCTSFQTYCQKRLFSRMPFCLYPYMQWIKMTENNKIPFTHWIGS